MRRDGPSCRCLLALFGVNTGYDVHQVTSTESYLRSCKRASDKQALRTERSICLSVGKQLDPEEHATL